MSDTIFVRSIPYEATEESFKLFFQKFGSIIYAKLCKNRMTDTPNGTGFVKFTEALTAKNLLIQSKTPSKLNRTSTFS
jgi:RNA recognition motif-containing protein